MLPKIEVMSSLNASKLVRVVRDLAVCERSKYRLIASGRYLKNDAHQ